MSRNGPVTLKWRMFYSVMQPSFSFVNGCHRTAWLIENQVDYVPLYIEIYENAWSLERFSGADICHIDLAEIF